MPSRYKSKKRVKAVQIPSPVLLKEFKPRTQNQYEYIRCIIESEITFSIGPAGSGKTACAIGLALEYLSEGKISKIVLTRPIVEASYKSLGALPGGILEKIGPYMTPLYEEIEGYLGKYKLDEYIKNGTIVICPLEVMRGRTFERSVIILDEAQNATFDQITMFISRLGESSKAIINGDTRQTDLPSRLAGGLSTHIEILNHVEGVSVSYLDKSDIQRNPIVGRILDKVEAYNDSRNSGSSDFR